MDVSLFILFRAGLGFRFYMLKCYIAACQAIVSNRPSSFVRLCEIIAPGDLAERLQRGLALQVQVDENAPSIKGFKGSDQVAKGKISGSGWL